MAPPSLCTPLISIKFWPWDSKGPWQTTWVGGLQWDGGMVAVAFISQIFYPGSSQRNCGFAWLILLSSSQDSWFITSVLGWRDYYLTIETETEIEIWMLLWSEVQGKQVPGVPTTDVVVTIMCESSLQPSQIGLSRFANWIWSFIYNNFQLFWSFPPFPHLLYTATV